MDFILERLAVGDIHDARNLHPRITALLNCSVEHDTFRQGIEYYKIPLVDFQPIIPEYIPKAVNWIKEMIVKHTILVHCNAGIGRAPSIVICYLHEVGFGFEEAVAFVQSKREGAIPLGNLRSAIMIAKKLAG